MNFLDVKYTTTLLCFLIQLIHITCVDISYFGLLDFTEIFNTSIASISLGISLRYAGSAIGSLTSAYLFKFCNKLIVSSSLLLVLGVCTCLLPNVKYAWAYFVVCFIAGITSGPIDAANIITICNIWKTKAEPFIQALTIMMFLASIAMQFATKPFLSETVLDTNHTLFNASSEFNSTSIDSIESDVKIEIIKQSNVWIPYLIMGGLACVVGCIGLFHQLLRVVFQSNNILEVNANRSVSNGNNNNNYKNDDSDINKNSNNNNKNDESDTNNNSSKKNEKNVDDTKKEKSKFYKISVACICSSMIFNIMVLIVSFYQFWPAFFTQCSLEIEKNLAISTITTFTYCALAGNCIALLLSTKLKPLIALIIICIVSLTGTILMTIFNSISYTVSVVGGCLLAGATGASFGNIINSIQTRIKMTDKVGTMYTFFYYFASATCLPVLVGKLMESELLAFIYYQYFFIAFIIFAVIALFVVDRIEEKRLTKIDGKF